MVLGTVVHTFNLSTQKADTGGSLSSGPDLIYIASSRTTKKDITSKQTMMVPCWGWSCALCIQLLTSVPTDLVQSGH